MSEEGTPIVEPEQAGTEAADSTVTPPAEGLPEQYAGEDEVVTQGANPYEGNDGHSVNADEAEAAGGIAVGGAAGQPGADSVELAPNNILHEPGVNSSEGDAPYVDPESPTTEHDVNTALEEATASHDLFSNAANLRRRNLRAEKLQAQHQETADDPRFLKPNRPWQRGRDPRISDWGREQTWKEIAEWRDSITEKNDDQGELRELLGEVDGFDTGTFWNRDYAPERREAFAQANERSKQWHIEKARERDEEAKARAEWGGLVGKVSEEYKVAHPEFGFGVEEMMALEDAVKDDERYLPEEIEQLEKASTYYDDPVNLAGGNILRTIENTITTVSKSESSPEVSQDLDKRFDAIMKDKATNLGNIVDFFKEARAAQIAVLKAAAEERKTVLEDVKSGRASQSPESPEAQQAA